MKTNCLQRYFSHSNRLFTHLTSWGVSAFFLVLIAYPSHLVFAGIESDYDLVGLPRTANLDDLKKSFRKMAMAYHPDRYIRTTQAEQKAAEEEFKKRYAAFERIKKHIEGQGHNSTTTETKSSVKNPEGPMYGSYREIWLGAFDGFIFTSGEHVPYPHFGSTNVNSLEEAIKFFENPPVIDAVYHESSAPHYLQSFLTRLRASLEVIRKSVADAKGNALVTTRLNDALIKFYEQYGRMHGEGLINHLSFSDKSRYTNFNDEKHIVSAAYESMDNAGKPYVLTAAVNDELNVAINDLVTTLTMLTGKQDFIVDRFKDLEARQKDPNYARVKNNEWWRGSNKIKIDWAHNIQVATDELAPLLFDASALPQEKQRDLIRLSYSSPQIRAVVEPKQHSDSLVLSNEDRDAETVFRFSREPYAATPHAVEEMTTLLSRWSEVSKKLPPDVRRTLLLSLIDLDISKFSTQGKALTNLQRAVGAAVAAETGGVLELEDRNQGRKIDFFDLVAVTLRPDSPKMTLLSDEDRLKVLPTHDMKNFRPWYSTGMKEWDFAGTLNSTVERYPGGRNEDGYIFQLSRVMDKNKITPLQARAFLRIASYPNSLDFRGYEWVFRNAMSEFGHSRLYFEILKDPIAKKVYHSYNRMLGFLMVGNTPGCFLIFKRLISPLLKLKNADK